MRAASFTFLFVIIAGSLSGCQSLGLVTSYGPAPVIDPDDAHSSVQKQLATLAAFSSAAGVGLPAAGSSDWFAVTETGFNYVDEKCTAYIDELFVADRDQNKLKGLAILADKTSGAILFASGVAKVAMTVVSQSFGFVEGATDLISNSYLYQIKPSRIQMVEDNLRNAYRKLVYSHKDSIKYPSLAYHHIQKYLELCLPQRIESEIDTVLGKTGAAPAPTSGAASPDVHLTPTPTQAGAVTCDGLSQEIATLDLSIHAQNIEAFNKTQQKKRMHCPIA